MVASSNQESIVAESRSDKSAETSSSPDELVKDLHVEVSEDEQDKVKGGAADIFAKLGDIKGESSRSG
jgi:hypothetical protein